jgi:hypothetical protein
MLHLTVPKAEPKREPEAAIHEPDHVEAAFIPRRIREDEGKRADQNCDVEQAVPPPSWNRCSNTARAAA